MSAPVRPPLKKTRHCDEDEDDEEEGGVARYGHTDCEDILFRKPRPLVSDMLVSCSSGKSTCVWDYDNVCVDAMTLQ